MKPLKPLQKRPKFKCPDCKKSYSQVWKCKDGIKRCRNCKRTLPTNKFYIPLKERKNLLGKIGKFSITAWERQRLYNQFISQGQDPETAGRNVARHIGILKSMGRRKRGLEAIRRLRESKDREESKELKKKFVEGLK